MTTALTPLPLDTSRAIPARHLTVLLLACAVAFATSMPLPWHHDVIPAAGYRVVYGIGGASWLVVAAVLCAVFALMFALRRPAFYSRWLVTLLGFCVVLGVFTDYINWQNSAGRLYVAAYFGPGFYVALGGMLLLVLTVVLTWRASD